MPYLNWKEKSVTVEARPHSRLETELALELTAGDREELLTSLQNVLGSPGAGPHSGDGAEGAPASELRLDLPSGWAIFFKRREGESRLLVAHPETDAWVATVALESSHARATLEGLTSLAPGEKLQVAERGSVSGVSNCELSIRLRS